MSKYPPLSEMDFCPDPFTQFGQWYNLHQSDSIEIPNSFSLGTASAEGRVSLRTVLLKGYDDSGFTFFTNYNSRKFLDLSGNHMSAMLFYWQECKRQIRIEGPVIKLSEEESEMYFVSRPRESQLSAWASEQSSVIPDRQYLEKRYESFKSRFNGMAVQRPPYWGGLKLLPDRFEFWQDGDFRLHDRISYTKLNSLWKIERLAP